jgi:hypothetical protein
VGDPFDLLDRGPLSGERSGMAPGGAELTTLGTGLLIGELAGLLLEEQLESSFGQSLGRSGSDLLEGAEVHIESGSVVAKGPLGDDLGPLAGEFVELLEFLGCESG